LVRTDSLRITAVGASAHVAIGTEPTATIGDYIILAGTSETLATSVASQRVVGITTGSTTIINFPEGTGSPFNVGDYVSFTSVGQPYYNFTHSPVISVDDSSGVGGYYSTRVSIGTNTSGITTAFSSDGELRKSLKVAALTTSGTGKIYVQQVQISGDA
jgi:hypothetical protein